MVSVEINAGSRISIEFTGNQLLGDKLLLRLWPDNMGRIRDGDLGMFKRRIIAKYRRFGFFHVQVTGKGYLDEKEGISLNSAKASLSGFSEKLEKRRQAFKEERLKKQQEKEA